MEKSKLTFYAAKKFSITRRTIYRWIESGISLSEIENKMREAGSDTLLKPSVVANKFNVSINVVYGWINRGKVESFRLFFGILRVKKKSLSNIK